ncbi:MAG: Gfo/Idh/MocA family oxidoreductase [Acidobacteriaceae bacterium]|nr:Gfo/Idh/MocA family oxidoreductase [Acidobacteriaceae bacterium]
MADDSGTPLRIGVVGLVHGHVAGFLNGALKRSDVQIVGIAEPDRALFDKYSKRYRLEASLYCASIEDLVSRFHPEGVVTYTNSFDHRRVVEECARYRIHVMMEKPLAVSYADALAMQRAADSARIHVLVNYETTWYASNKAAYDLIHSRALGELRKVVAHDGHQGPKEIGVPPEFFAWLSDPKLNGAGALYDFGCYGADLMTWLMNGEAPRTVTAVTAQFKPNIYPRVDDEADIILSYPSAIAILEASWNWPFNIKDMIVYGSTGTAKTILRDKIEVRREGQPAATTSEATPLSAPNDDPIHYLRAIIRGEVEEGNSLSALSTNVTVSEILDAARQSAQRGKAVTLPLAPGE